MLCICDIFLPLDGITKLIYKSHKGAVFCVKEINKCSYKLNIPKTPRNIETDPNAFQVI